MGPICRSMPKSKPTFLPNYLSELADRIGHFSPVDFAIVLGRTEFNRQMVNIERILEI
jgi:hypothetical protein